MTPEMRRRALEEWRGLPHPRPRPDRTVSAGDAAAKWLHSLGLSERITENDIQSAWRDIVGDFLAAHSAPSRLREGTLFVCVIQPTVHYELDRIWKPQVLQKLKSRYGATRIRAVKFVVG